MEDLEYHGLHPRKEPEIIAAFDGDESYGSSGDSTYNTVGPAASASGTIQPEPQEPSSGGTTPTEPPTEPTPNQPTPEQPTPEEQTLEHPTPEEPTSEEPEPTVEETTTHQHRTSNRHRSRGSMHHRRSSIHRTKRR